MAQLATSLASVQPFRRLEMGWLSSAWTLFAPRWKAMQAAVETPALAVVAFVLSGGGPSAQGHQKKGGKHIGGYFAPEVSRQLRQMAPDENSSVQALLGEALDLLFESRRLPTIAGPPDSP